MAARDSVAALVESMGLSYELFDSAEAFLDTYIASGSPGCIVTDLRMVGLSGLELQKKLKDHDVTLPLVMITAYATTQTAVEAMKLGAVTFLEKGCSEQELWDGIAAGVRASRTSILEKKSLSDVRERLALLNPEEKKVLDLISRGSANKQVAAELGISIRTVEERRRRVMHKLQVSTFAELMRFVVDAEYAHLATFGPPAPR
jgi:FixJ family two-component response regulator